MIFRKISCFILGHVRKCYLKPATIQDVIDFHNMRKKLNLEYSPFWRKFDKGWCAYCGTHTSEPARLRK